MALRSGLLPAGRDAACLDLGVEHRIAAAAANGLTKPTPKQRAIAERIVQDVIRTGVARDDVIRAAVLAVWGLAGARARRPKLSARG
jgi:hypothetical protein